MQLARLLELAGLRNPGGLGGVNGMGADVSGVAYDSRQVRAGMVFTLEPKIWKPGHVHAPPTHSAPGSHPPEVHFSPIFANRPSTQRSPAQ